MEYIGIDVHKRDCQVCIITEGGDIIEKRIRTDRQRLAELLGKQRRARILIEAATESEWVARHLEELGHEVVVGDPNFAPMYANPDRRVKTDRRDARVCGDRARELDPPRATASRRGSRRWGLPSDPLAFGCRLDKDPRSSLLA